MHAVCDLSYFQADTQQEVYTQKYNPKEKFRFALIIA